MSAAERALADVGRFAADPAQRTPVTTGWVVRYGLLYLGQNISWAAPTQLLLAQQILVWHPGDKESKLALLMAIGGFFSIVGHPLAGWLSDRTDSRWGRRAPWILFGGLAAAGALMFLGAAPGFAALTLGWAVFQLAIAASINAAQAVAPDTVPDHQYGVVSGVLGLTYTLGVVLGTVVATVFDLGLAYIVTAALLLALIFQFMPGFRDVSRVRHRGALAPVPYDDDVEPVVPAVAESPGGLYRDFNWVFLARFLVTTGNSVALFYLFYYLRDHIRHGDPDSGVLVLTGAYAGCVILTAVASGRLSDKLGKRRVFVAASSLGVAGACAVMAVAESFGTVVGAAVLLGLSWGVFMAVDQALINQVLPKADERGRDVGVMNLAVAGPNMAAPVLAAFALANLGGYPGLYFFAGALTAVGAVLVYGVRSVP
ncbi:MFS transporter [Corynebacterium hansenii]|uniref:MFS transporter n=1 Tax=Corynebacterium hansenii TaxID=394964 RepID=A0ABV7ZJU9_9CORY|nr:MFS transporter [Corynebacterium hansenii]WJY99352.1 melibiose:sodium symporter [Corynebacterium hansenii]